MADELPTNQENVDTPIDSLSNNEPQVTSDNDETQSPSPEPKVTDEPEGWNQLSGKTQDRIKKLIQERNEWMNRATSVAQTTQQQVPPQYPTNQPHVVDDDEVNRAINRLKERGVATKDDVKRELEEALSRIETNRMHDDLERRYNGSDGRPRYDRSEVEDYAKKNSIWNLEAAYRDMYFDELMDYGRKHTPTNPTRPGSSERPHAGQPKDTLNLDTFRKKLSGPEGRKYYEQLAKNPEQLDRLVTELTQGE